VIVVDVAGLRKEYRAKVAVQEVTFSVEDGEIFGIIGPNGAGKTTIVECIEGLRVPDRGTIRVLGLDPQHDGAELRQLLGGQLQESELPDKLTVAEAISLYSSFYRSPADGAALLEVLGLAALRKRRYRKLSGGQKQRLSIALALIGQPRIAVLDELTTGLDPQARRDTWSLVRDIRDQGVTILLVTHFMEEAERLCDRAMLVAAGRVEAIGSPAGLIASTGVEQRIRFHPSGQLADGLLAAVPGVTSVARAGPEVTVTGTGDVLGAVTFALAGAGIVAERLDVQRPSLEDAFVSLTSRPPDSRLHPKETVSARRRGARP
jgi:ABC-2 type transport system ATP-binding protein